MTTITFQLALIVVAMLGNVSKKMVFQLDALHAQVESDCVASRPLLLILLELCTKICEIIFNPASTDGCN